MNQEVQTVYCADCESEAGANDDAHLYEATLLSSGEVLDIWLCDNCKPQE
jgi:hypothetical protein